MGLDTAFECWGGVDTFSKEKIYVSFVFGVELVPIGICIVQDMREFTWVRS